MKTNEGMYFSAYRAPSGEDRNRVGVSISTKLFSNKNVRAVLAI
jgi:RNase P protein component